MKNLVDSCGWIEFFMGAPNAQFFSAAINDTENLIVPTICLAEVFKILYRELGRKMALKYTVAMQAGQVLELDKGISLAAGLLSIEEKLPLADSIILVSARISGAALWTQEAHLKSFPEVKYVVKK